MERVTYWYHNGVALTVRQSPSRDLGEAMDKAAATLNEFGIQMPELTPFVDWEDESDTDAVEMDSTLKSLITGR